MMTLTERWKRYNDAYEQSLYHLYSGCQTLPQARLFQAMNYSLQAGGKRLRPFLVSLFCEACGGSDEQSRPAAFAIEMIHTYSLIHDDLPAMDNDDYRRGKLTNHKVYGEALAILAGDGLLTDAFRVLNNKVLTPDMASACTRILAENAGPYGMVGGQVLDMEAEQRACTESEVIAIESRKTGALIRAACQMGVVCGGGTVEQLEAAGVYADNVGMAFQIRDDMLDVIGDADKLGKATGMDAGKNTFVRLYGIERCQQLTERYTNCAVDALNVFADHTALSELAHLLANRDH